MTIFNWGCAQAAIAEAHAHGFTGYNLDWEVDRQWADDPMCHDTIVFLTKFANALHGASPRIGLSIDIPAGSSMCSPDSTRLFAALPADRVITMGSYSATSPTVADFHRYMVDGLAAFGNRFGMVR